MKFREKHLFGCTGNNWVCQNPDTICNKPAMIGSAEPPADALCLEHLHLLPSRDWKSVFIPQRITGTLRDEIFNYIKHTFPDCEKPEPVTAPKKIGCRDITYTAKGIDAEGYSLSREELAAMLAKCDELANEPKEKYLYRIKFDTSDALTGGYYSHTYKTKAEAEEYAAKYPKVKVCRVLADNPDQEV